MNKIIYLDAAATYQKSDAVINAEIDFLRNHYANAGRGVCERAMFVDDMVAGARGRVAAMMNTTAEHIVFTSGTTDGMNQIARMLNLCADSVVAVSDLDHHSARLPFAMTGAKIVTCPLNENFDFDVDNIPWANVLVVTAMSNVLGRPQDVAKIVARARGKNNNAIIVVDAAQFVVHEKIDVRAWDADFVCWSAHKIGGDTGLGIMYIKNPELWRPTKFGGGMVNRICGDDISYSCAPEIFEAGTMPLTQIAGLDCAISNIEKNRPDLKLIRFMYDELCVDKRIKILSNRDAAMLTFVVDGMHVLDVGAMLGARGVCVRVGNMCASWIHNLLGVPGSVRVSVGAYNTIDEVKQVTKYIKDIVK